MSEENWIEIVGPEGSIVQVVIGTQAWTHLITAHPGMASSQPSSIHVGLGDIEQVDFISLRQPWKEPVFLLGPIQSKQKILRKIYPERLYRTGYVTLDELHPVSIRQRGGSN